MNFRQLSLPWLRDRISLVGQEPVLFAMTTAENVALGKLDATREERSFKLFKTPEHWTLFATYRRFETNVGDRGGHISGVQ